MKGRLEARPELDPPRSEPQGNFALVEVAAAIADSIQHATGTRTRELLEILHKRLLNGSRLRGR